MDTSSKLRVPFAVDETNKVCSPDLAQRGCAYFCPACSDSLIFKKGPRKVAHFAHKATNTCNQETITHKTAKLLVQKAISEWKSGIISSPTVKRHCDDCGSDILQPLTEKVESSAIECRLSSNCVADVGLMVGGQPVAAIEIRVTHAVDERKASLLPIPFIELDGNEVIAHPTAWNPLVDRFNRPPCLTCARNFEAFQKKTAAVAASMGITLPTSYYRYSLYTCWKCRRPIIVFASPPQEAVPKNQPSPSTIQYRYSKMAGDKYWANVCIYCDSLQGDNYLHWEPDGPFFCQLDYGPGARQFQEDLKKLANYAARIGLL
jgi:hypothetical protein